MDAVASRTAPNSNMFSSRVACITSGRLSPPRRMLARSPGPLQPALQNRRPRSDHGLSYATLTLRVQAVAAAEVPAEVASFQGKSAIVVANQVKMPLIAIAEM
jgi:hypothetical protein